MGKRISQHFSETLSRKYASINPFYADIKTYGAEAFEIKCLELCQPNDKLDTERKWYHVIQPEYNLVEPDACPFNHEEVRKKSIEACKTPESIELRRKIHESERFRNRCRDIQRKRMIPCKAIDEHGLEKTFVSLCEAARWLHRESALTCVISSIRDAAKRHGTAYGYRWEVINE